MANINIQLPISDADQAVEIDVKINGARHKYHYRVEILKWEECSDIENKADCIKHMVKNYSEDWQLIQIGIPTKKEIPIMFRQKQYENISH